MLVRKKSSPGVWKKDSLIRSCCFPCGKENLQHLIQSMAESQLSTEKNTWNMIVHYLPTKTPSKVGAK